MTHSVYITTRLHRRLGIGVQRLAVVIVCLFKKAFLYGVANPCPVYFPAKPREMHFTSKQFRRCMTCPALSSSLYPHDHGCVAMVPSHGPAPPFAEGVIAASVCWDTLNLGQQGNVR
jgi:hypothetical protein